VLVCATPQHAHVTPLLAVAGVLTRAGVHVVVLTGRRYQDAVEATGAVFTPVDPRFDHDDRRLEEVFPGMAGKTGLAAMRFAMRNVFLPPMPSQLVDVTSAVRDSGIDVVVTDPLFLGGIAYALQPRPRRRPVAVIGLVPLMLDSRDTAPFGLGLRPMRGPVGRVRNAALRALAHRVLLAGVERDVDRAFAAAAGTPRGTTVLDLGRSVDAYLQLTVPAFEYPRRDLPPTVSFVGPLSGRPPREVPLPDWWDDLDGRTVVHVTQGTVSNAVVEDLLVPAARGLAGEDVLVVAATGRDPGPLLAALGTPPANLRIAPFLPYERLLPRTAVMVTNGGYGGVHAALRHGVPLVVAGRTEEKVEVAARVAWSGVGIDLRAQRPRPDAVRDAVRRVLTEPVYRARAGAIGADIRAADGESSLVAALARLAGRDVLTCNPSRTDTFSVRQVEGDRRRTCGTSMRPSASARTPASSCSPTSCAPPRPSAGRPVPRRCSPSRSATRASRSSGSRCRSTSTTTRSAASGRCRTRAGTTSSADAGARRPARGRGACC
jgi:UDP:flavonoid glycosyltransferase YjiC (YdhE family)